MPAHPVVEVESHGERGGISLGAVAELVEGHKELGEGKLEYEGTINDIYKTNWNRFTEYNIQDVLLLVRLEKKLKLFSLIIEYAYDCVTTVDKVFQKVPTTEGYILKFIHGKNKLMNDSLDLAFLRRGSDPRIDKFHKFRNLQELCRGPTCVLSSNDRAQSVQDSYVFLWPQNPKYAPVLR